MLVLGIDPGTAITGVGIIEVLNGRYRLIDGGVIRTPAHTPMPARLLTIHTELTQLIEQHHPTVMAVEQLFHFRNATTVIPVSQARGVVLLVAAQHELPLFEYTPLQVKMAVVGYGGADKRQVQEMVKQVLKLNMIPKPDDAADALAVAICHVNSSTYLEQGKGVTG
ncbi:MAG: crossover junction endodeoxyribonuclease RuvC [Methanomassiliicoccales archaeon]